MLAYIRYIVFTLARLKNVNSTGNYIFYFYSEIISNHWKYFKTIIEYFLTYMYYLCNFTAKSEKLIYVEFVVRSVINNNN